jgi:hypothetical protein
MQAPFGAAAGRPSIKKHRSGAVRKRRQPKDKKRKKDLTNQENIGIISCFLSQSEKKTSSTD